MNQHEQLNGIRGGTPKKHAVFHIINDIVSWSAPDLYWNFNKEGFLGQAKLTITHRNGKEVHVCRGRRELAGEEGVGQRPGGC
jgi:hypothetical protein